MVSFYSLFYRPPNPHMYSDNILKRNHQITSAFVLALKSAQASTYSAHRVTVGPLIVGHEYYISGIFKWTPLINMVNTLEGTIKPLHISASWSRGSRESSPVQPLKIKCTLLEKYPGTAVYFCLNLHFCESFSFSFLWLVSLYWQNMQVPASAVIHVFSRAFLNFAAFLPFWGSIKPKSPTDYVV